MKTVGSEILPPAIKAHRLLLDSLDKRWEKYRSELKRCRTEFSNEAVHDLRIATRRMMVLIQLLRTLDPRPRLQKLQRTFKDQLDSFDDLRDTQVMLADVSETLQELAQLRPFEEYLIKNEESLLRTVKEKFKQIQPRGIAKRVDKTRESLEDQALEHLEDRLLQAVDDAFLLTKQRFGWVNPADPPTIHRVRLAFKKFRYLIEIINPMVPAFPMEHFKGMNDYQGAMGEIQDIEILLHTFADFSPASFTENKPVRRFYERRHAQAISAYVENMNELKVFWRATPDQSFPWEKTK
jgi:CHAD domain-containing protein